MTEARQLKAKDAYCLRHATTGQIEKVADAIIALSDGAAARKKADVFDGLAMGVVQRGDRSSCTAMPDLKPGKYLYQIFVADVLVAALPFEIIQ